MSDTWTIGELVERAAGTLRPMSQRPNGRVRDVPNERLIRWYTTIGLLDPPLTRRGRVALYGRRHLLQLIAVKRRQAEGRSIADIQAELAGATDTTLATIARLPATAPTGAETGTGGDAGSPANPAGAGPGGRHAPDIPAARPRFWAERPAIPRAASGLASTALPDPPPADPPGYAPPGSPGPMTPDGPRPAWPGEPGLVPPDASGFPPPDVSGSPRPGVPRLAPPNVPGLTPPDLPGLTPPDVPGLTPPHVPGLTPPGVPGLTSPDVPGPRPGVPAPPGHPDADAYPSPYPPGLLHGVRLAPGVTLLLEGRAPAPGDVAAIHEAATPLLAALRDRNLAEPAGATDPAGTADPSDPPDSGPADPGVRPDLDRSPSEGIQA
jgi:DNA-binding transcriptional MerR regulator